MTNTWQTFEPKPIHSRRTLWSILSGEKPLLRRTLPLFLSPNPTPPPPLPFYSSDISQYLQLGLEHDKRETLILALWWVQICYWWKQIWEGARHCHSSAISYLFLLMCENRKSDEQGGESFKKLLIIFRIYVYFYKSTRISNWWIGQFFYFYYTSLGTFQIVLHTVLFFNFSLKWYQGMGFSNLK